MKWMAALALIFLMGCENPSLGIGATINSGGISVSPKVSGRVGGVGVTVTP